MYSGYQEMKAFHRRARDISLHELLVAEIDNAELVDKSLLELQWHFRSPLGVQKIGAFFGEYSGLISLTAVLYTFMDDDVVMSRTMTLLEHIFREKPESLNKYDFTINWLRWGVNNFVNDVDGLIKNLRKRSVSESVVIRLSAIVRVVESLKITPTRSQKEMPKLVSLVRLVRRQINQSDDIAAMKVNVVQMCSLFSWIVHFNVHSIIKWEVYHVLMDLIERYDPLKAAAKQLRSNHQTVQSLAINTLLSHFIRLRSVTVEFIDVILAEINHYTSQCGLQRDDDDDDDCQVFCCDWQPPTSWQFKLCKQEISWPEFPPLPKIFDNDINVENYLEVLSRFLRDPKRPKHRDQQIFDCIINYLTQTPEPFLLASWDAIQSLIYKTGFETANGTHKILDSKWPIDFEQVILLNVPWEIQLRMVHPFQERCCPLHINVRRLGSAILGVLRKQANDNISQVHDALKSDTGAFRLNFFHNLPMLVSDTQILREFIVDFDGLDCICKELFSCDPLARRCAALSVMMLAATLEIDESFWPAFLYVYGDDDDEESILNVEELGQQVSLLKEVFHVELNSLVKKKSGRKSFTI